MRIKNQPPRLSRSALKVFHSKLRLSWAVTISKSVEQCIIAMPHTKTHDGFINSILVVIIKFYKLFILMSRVRAEKVCLGWSGNTRIRLWWPSQCWRLILLYFIFSSLWVGLCGALNGLSSPDRGSENKSPNKMRIPPLSQM